MQIDFFVMCLRLVPNIDLEICYVSHAVGWIGRLQSFYTCAMPDTEIGTPSTVYTLGESTFNVIVFKFNLEEYKAPTENCSSST